MEIGTNELTRPFRIPRKKGGKNEDEKGVQKIGPNESVQRSPLANAVTPRKNETFSNRIVPPTKRKASQEMRGAVNAKKATVKGVSGGDVFDTIIGNMVNPPKDKKAEAAKEREEAPGPSGTNGGKNLNMNIRRLTKDELDRQAIDNGACYAFLRKDGLMEQLLGHKMLNGRVDSYATLGYLPLDPSEQSFGRKTNYNCSNSFDDFPTICEPPPVAIATEERRGPRTPPGSPGRQDNSSMVSSRGAGSATQSSHPPPPPPLPPDEEQKEKGVPNKADETGRPTDNVKPSSAVINELEKCTHYQLAELLVGELQYAMKQVDHKVLLSTLKDALMKVGKKSEQNESDKISPIKKEEVCNESIINPPVEMDIESEHSGVAADDSVLPPPPPAPCTPPLITGTNLVATISAPLATAVVPPPPCILPTPPPPPPLVLQAAPPPPVIMRPPPAQAVLIQPTLPAPPIILQPAPPAPVLTPAQMAPQVPEVSANISTQQQQTTNATLSKTLPSSFIQQSQLQRSFEQQQSLQAMSAATVNADLRAPSPLFSTPNIAMPFTAPPPPMIVNTAVPPPNYNNAQTMQQLQTSSVTSADALSAALQMQSSLNSQMPNSVLASTASSLIGTNSSYAPQKPPLLQVVCQQTSGIEEQSHPPVNPNQIDFTKPPPPSSSGVVGPPPPPPQTSASAGTVSTSSQWQTTSAQITSQFSCNSSGSSINNRLQSQPSVDISANSTAIRLQNLANQNNQLQNLNFASNTPGLLSPSQKHPTQSDIVGSLPLYSSKTTQNVSTTTTKTSFNQPSISLNSSSLNTGHQNTLLPNPETATNTTPTSETVIKTLLNALAIPQKSQQQSNSQQSPLRPSVNSLQSAPSSIGGILMNASTCSVGNLDRFGSGSVLNATGTSKSVPNQKQTSGSGATKKFGRGSSANRSGGDKEKNVGRGKEGKRLKNSVNKKNENSNKRFRNSKETVLDEKPITFFGTPAPTSKKPVPPPLTPPPIRSRLDMQDKSMLVPPAFVHHQPMRPRFPPTSFRMRGPYPFGMRRSMPPFPPCAPGFRMPRPRFNR
uniref:WH2 domain-containing protein n=1 Tax=Syphacia muris TaxID=451379 RepID=A0A0N5ANY6_9BILA